MWVLLLQNGGHIDRRYAGYGLQRHNKGRIRVEISLVNGVSCEDLKALYLRSTLKGTRKGSPLLKSLSIFHHRHVKDMTTSRDDAHTGLYVEGGAFSVFADS